MSSNQVIYQYLSAGSHTLTVPDGFSNQVLVYAWGAGGADSQAGVAGGGGGYASGIITISSGDTVIVSVGSTGSPDGIGGSGTNPVISLSGGSSGPVTSNDWDGKSGPGAGGGAASAVLVNSIPMIVAGGGGGGGGGFDYQRGSIGTAGGSTTGTPLLGITVVPPYPPNITEFNKYVTSGLKGIVYGDYSTTYSLWYTVTSPFPTIWTSTPGYTPDPNAVAFVAYHGDSKAWSTNVNATTFTVGSQTYTRGNIAYYTGTTTYTLPGVSYTANVVIYNYTITSVSEASALNSIPQGGISPNGYAVGGGGGGGYPYGGSGGTSAGDDAGGGGGGYGGQSYANSTIITSELRPGSTSIAGGTDTAFYPKAKRGYNGYDGAVIIIFTKSFKAYIKDTTWKAINNAWVKVGDTTVTTTSSPVVTTTNYTPTPSTLDGLIASINNTLDGGVDSDTGWYTFSPNLVDFLRTADISVLELPSDVRAILNDDLAIDIDGTTVYSTSEDTLTSITVGDNTYTRGTLAYSGAVTFTVNKISGGTVMWTTTINVYNFSKTFTSVSTIATTTSDGGWKQITRAWIKNNDTWQPLQSGVSLTPLKLDSAPTSPVTINLTIAANTNNYVLSDFLSATSYYPGHSIVNLYVNAGVIVGSGTVGTAALVIDGLVSGDLLNLTNNGNIAGAGGQGGAAGSFIGTTVGGGYMSKGKVTTVYTAIPGRPGEIGGPALYVTYPTNLVNNGTIAGGGGGGGGGGGPTGGQGGGGAGRKAGSGANNGTITAGGAGSGLGGAAGARGSAGSAGTNSSSAGGLGGDPGAAIIGIDKVTINTEGTILGTRIV